MAQSQIQKTKIHDLKLAAAIDKLERGIRENNRILKDLIKIAEALNENLNQLGRMIKEKQDGSE